MRQYVVLLCFILGQISAVTATQIGPIESVIENFRQQKLQQSALYTMPVGAQDSVNLDLDHYVYEEGSLSLSGTAPTIPNSDFMLRADPEDVYGWVHLRDKNIAYRYQTDDDGQVYIDTVPEEMILAIDDWITPPAADDFSVIDEYDNFVQNNELPDIIHIGEMPEGQTARTLQSRPESDKVVYLDIEDYTHQTDQEILIMWQYQAAGLSMFDVNVTTSRDVYNATPARNRGRNHMTNTDGRSYCYVHSFGTNRGCTVFYDSNPSGLGRTGIHEIGHMLGVRDAGSGQHGTYFPGLAEFRWVPIMGNFWSGNRWGSEALYQWSKGEYNDANSAAKQPFFDSQYAQNHIRLRSDDKPEPVALVFGGDGTSVSMKDNFGRIGPPVSPHSTSADRDDFTFEITAENGSIDVVVSSIERLQMLDVHAQVLNSSGQVVTEHNPKSARSSTLQANLPRGSYTLRVMGGAEGTPQNGFSNYGSAGYYGISGTIEGAGNAVYYDLSLNAENGSISADPDESSFEEGTEVELTAEADFGYTFSGWSGDISGSDNPVTITMDSDKNVTAQFEIDDIDIEGDNLS
ncbi:MAG: InlB B-repeat-containing protein, partial [Fibrobacterota bacterium]